MDSVVGGYKKWIVLFPIQGALLDIVLILQCFYWKKISLLYFSARMYSWCHHIHRCPFSDYSWWFRQVFYT